MDLELEGKVALVTGGSRGIGKAICTRLAKEGARVIFTYGSNEAAAKETLELLKREGNNASCMRFDVGNSGECSDAVKVIAKEHGSLDILINNAGVALDNLIMRYKDEDLLKIFQTNVFGSFYLTRAAVRPMMKGKFGRVIMLGSVVGQMGNNGQAAYASTKSALEGLAKSVAKEFGSRGVTANVVAPGFINTDMTEEMTEEMRKTLLSQIATETLGEVEDIADAVAFLSSPRARYITGHVLAVNGGLRM